MSIQNNVVHDNGMNGLMLHRSCDYATIKNNTAYANMDAGLALYESSNCEVSGNSFYWNKCEHDFAEPFIWKAITSLSIHGETLHAGTG